MPPPGFLGIVRSLWGEHSLQIVIRVPAREYEKSYKAVGSSIMVTQLLWHPTLGEMFIDMLTCTLSVVDLGVDLMVVVCPGPALQEHSDSDLTVPLLTIICPPATLNRFSSDMFTTMF